MYEMAIVFQHNWLIELHLYTNHSKVWDQKNVFIFIERTAFINQGIVMLQKLSVSNKCCNFEQRIQFPPKY